MSGGVGQNPVSWVWRRLHAGAAEAAAAVTSRNIPWIGNVAGLAGILSFLGGLSLYAVSLLDRPSFIPDGPQDRLNQAEFPPGAPALPSDPARTPLLDPSPLHLAPIRRLAGLPHMPGEAPSARPFESAALEVPVGSPLVRAEAPPTRVRLTQGIPRPFPRLPFTVESCSGGPKVQIDRADLDSAARGGLKVFGTIAGTLPVKVAENCWISGIIYTDDKRHDSGGTITFSREEM
ncbi:hypothetical protein [Roseobacter sinensis]|uniref:Uncharacterized protein n=1 Tax=Roseobacter sinensis TaxID=2931391 RepID=A0ABT3BAJ1_9RHOB|nr:hypothetical protein [Roseobacter sp. WL0113]MCV3270572.1 hypothetical protein [Roseobacter sp. WL0113]